VEPDNSAREVVRGNSGRKTLTPMSAFCIPILESLEELGGSGRLPAILNRVAVRMFNTFTRDDLRLVPGSSQRRWEVSVRLQRATMIKAGLLQGESARGYWEITESGKKWLKQQRRNAGEPENSEHNCPNCERAAMEIYMCPACGFEYCDTCFTDNLCPACGTSFAVRCR
jgi:hypothetical protein